MTTVSTRKLKNGLSAYLRRAEKGERIVVMRGGKAVAVIVPFEEAEGFDEDARLRQLAARDRVILPDATVRAGTFAGPRIPARGKPAAQMVLEDRR
jgi:prevent-host-death family protein